MGGRSVAKGLLLPQVIPEVQPAEHSYGLLLAWHPVRKLRELPPMSFKPLALAYSIIVCGLMTRLPADSVAPSADDILARVEVATNRRHLELTEYSGSPQYPMQNGRFGQQAAVAVLMSYREIEGDKFIVVTRSGSAQLNGIIDKLLSSEAGASLPPENARHQITSANYRVHLLGTGGRRGANLLGAGTIVLG